jgi:flavorubredoxin
MNYAQLEKIQKEIKECKRIICEQYSFIDALLLEADAVMSNILLTTNPNDVELLFDKDQRTITWNGGCLRLGHKSWLFLKALWEGRRHICSVEKIEQIVWVKQNRKSRLVKVGNRTITVDTVSRNTFNSFLRRLQNEINGKFPYKIASVKSRETREIMAYRLKRTKKCKNFSKNAQ